MRSILAVQLDLAAVRQGQGVRLDLLLKKGGPHSLFPERFFGIEEPLRNDGQEELLVAAIAEGVGDQGAVIGVSASFRRSACASFLFPAVTGLSHSL